MKTIDDWAKVKGMFVITPALLSNGYIAVHCPDEWFEGVNAPPAWSMDHITALINRPLQHELKELPAVDFPKEACRHCYGEKWIEDCESCNGDGVITCDHCGETHDCPDCNGDGYRCGEDKPFFCNVCVGTRVRVGEGNVAVGGAWVMLRHIAMLRILPGLRIETPMPGQEDLVKDLVFVFDGGRGVLTVRRSEERQK